VRACLWRLPLSLARYGKQAIAEELDAAAGRDASLGQAGPTAAPIAPFDVFAAHSYGNSSKSRARRAEARKAAGGKGKKVAVVRAGPSALHLDSWLGIGDEALVRPEGKEG